MPKKKSGVRILQRCALAVASSNWDRLSPSVQKTRLIDLWIQLIARVDEQLPTQATELVAKALILHIERDFTEFPIVNPGITDWLLSQVPDFFQIWIDGQSKWELVSTADHPYKILIQTEPFEADEPPDLIAVGYSGSSICLN